MTSFSSNMINVPARVRNESKVFSWVIFLLPALTLTTSFGVGMIEATILLGTFVYWKPLWQQRQYLFQSTRWIVGAFAFNLVVAVASLLLLGFQVNLLDNPLRQFLVVAVIGLILLTKPNAEVFWYGLFVGTVGAAGLSLYQRLGLKMERAEGFHLSIMFGDIAIAMGLLSLASAQHFAKTRLAIVPYIAFLAGLLASILSGSRGGWAALAMSAIPLYLYGHRATRRGLLSMAGVSLMSFIAACFIPQLSILKRFTDLADDINQYRLGHVYTSLGTRLEMWKGAWKLFLEHPLMGVGRANYHQGLNELIARGEIDPAVSDFYHAHNELLHALATQGMVGAFTLTGLYVAPLAFFIRCWRRHDASQAYALAGLLLVLSYMGFGLTQVMFSHHVGTAFYATTVCVLAGLCILTQRPERSI
jgi:O-antigen ligase